MMLNSSKSNTLDLDTTNTKASNFSSETAISLAKKLRKILQAESNVEWLKVEWAAEAVTFFGERRFIDWCTSIVGAGASAAMDFILMARAHKLASSAKEYHALGGWKGLAKIAGRPQREQVRTIAEAKATKRTITHVLNDQARKTATVPTKDEPITNAKVSKEAALLTDARSLAVWALDQKNAPAWIKSIAKRLTESA